MEIKCLVLYTEIVGRKNYICGKTTRPDNMFLVQHHSDVKEAIPFLTKDEVEKFKNKIVNHHHREYFTETAMLSDQNIKPIKIKNFDHARI